MTYRAPNQPDWTPELEEAYQRMSKPRVSGVFVGIINAVLLELIAVAFIAAWLFWLRHC